MYFKNKIDKNEKLSKLHKYKSSLKFSFFPTCSGYINCIFY